MKKDRRIKEIIHLFKCLNCSNTQFEEFDSYIKCNLCEKVFSCINNVPIFCELEHIPKNVDENHESNQIPPQILSSLKSINGYSLNIGAGSTSEFIPGCIELEYNIFKNTDVVANAHTLPFKDEVFELVVVLNAFEHFKNPQQVSDEIFRVIKPGGRIIIHTAFMQPLHEEPYHYYNATKYGVLAWFEKFNTTSCEVSENFHLGHTFSWLASDLLYNLEKFDSQVQNAFSKMTLQEWSNLWRKPVDRINNSLWYISSSLPSEIQERFSAGFQYEGTKTSEPTSYIEFNSHFRSDGELNYSLNLNSDNKSDIYMKRSESNFPMLINDTNSKINSIRIYITSAGNHFMTEFAQVFIEGFAANNIKAELIIDRIPSNVFDNKNIQIILSPHEFYNLFLDKHLTQDEINKITEVSYMLSGEQPNTPWFDIFCQRANGTRGIFDINQMTTEAFLNAGLPAIHVPLGYCSLFEKGAEDICLTDKNYDLLFLGSHSAKRELFISSNASLFNRYNSYLALSRLDRPKLLDTPGFYGDVDRNRIVRKSKILVNIHWTNNTYFEWLRAMISIANKCLFISEHSNCTEPLINNKHFIMSSLEDLSSYCEYYLINSNERNNIIAKAYEFVTEKFSSKIHCQKIINQVMSSHNF